jgi:hypothetical protein
MCRASAKCSFIHPSACSSLGLLPPGQGPPARDPPAGPGLALRRAAQGAGHDAADADADVDADGDGGEHDDFGGDGRGGKRGPGEKGGGGLRSVPWERLYHVCAYRSSVYKRARCLLCIKPKQSRKTNKGRKKNEMSQSVWHGRLLFAVLASLLCVGRAVRAFPPAHTHPNGECISMDDGCWPCLTPKNNEEDDALH